MTRKVYVDVTARFDKEGGLVPQSVIWEDGRRFEIDRVLDVRPAASLKAGGCGMRYTCCIWGRETFLFLEEDRWFVEGKKD
ncbi:hypothetical protein [Dehalobacterium formicoaceticum]|uniref:Uncharacterized protein n=1 Tax=Dehalobacterium formicoaceticum TaxID=51515 RepID=A0ABT1Y808_9FIRM|nr:hypothetical protein [Dehalobacterium formicoaceticum]MCR6546024.1 hypothetical protein [Dehalobacterium formicoaceticum]